MASLFPTLDVNYNNQPAGITEDGEYAFFDDVMMEPRVLRNYMRSMLTNTNMPLSTVGLSASDLTTALGRLHFSAATAFSTCHMSFGATASVGAVLILDFLNFVIDANMILSCSGAANITAKSGSTVSSINFSAAAYMVLYCATDDTWSIMENNTSATVQFA